MAAIRVSVALFVIMLLFPILFSLLSLRKSQNAALEIKQSEVRDPRYFVKSFTKLFDQQWVNYKGSGSIFLSREESIQMADGLIEYPYVCSSIVYAEKQDFRPQAGCRFNKEIYSCQNAYLYNIESVRAICCKKDLYLGSGTAILRWADAEGTLTCSDNCDLGISTSSVTKIIVGENCRFRRLYAPIILFGQASAAERLPDFHSIDAAFDSISLNRFWNIKYVNDNLTDHDGIFTGSIITMHNISVLNDLTVSGHIHSHKSISLCDNAVVYGNLFAEEDIYLGENSRVYGSIFAHGNVYIESGVVIGQHGKTKSVIARGRIIFNKNCCVFGYVSSETCGICCPSYTQSKVDRPYSRLLKHSHSENSYPQKKLLPSVISAVLVFAVITTSISATAVFKNIQEKENLREEKQAMANKIVYGIDGKTDGTMLETEPMAITKDYVYFNDRVLERFYYDAGNNIQCAEALSGIMAQFPEYINKYLMLIPARISFEDDEYQSYSDDADSAISEIYARMPSEIITLNAAGALNKHRNEYIFFRTDASWTALGAYYAAEEFCESAGIDMKTIGEYSENRYDHHFGTMYALPDAKSLRKYPDYVSYYIMEGAANKQTITSLYSKGTYQTYRAPTVAVSRKGSDIFVGSNFSHSILDGDAKNGKTLLIIGGKFGKPFSPWLTPYYENVILVNPKFFNGSSEQFWALFSEYHVTDLLIMEYVQDIGDNSLHKKMKEICSKQ